MGENEEEKENIHSNEKWSLKRKFHKDEFIPWGSLVCIWCLDQHTFLDEKYKSHSFVMDDVYLERGLLKRCLAGNGRLLSRVLMPAFRENKKEARKAWACIPAEDKRGLSSVCDYLDFVRGICQMQRSLYWRFQAGDGSSLHVKLTLTYFISQEWGFTKGEIKVCLKE